jgi:hypothetical protein
MSGVVLTAGSVLLEADLSKGGARGLDGLTASETR